MGRSWYRKLLIEWGPNTTKLGPGMDMRTVSQCLESLSGLKETSQQEGSRKRGVLSTLRMAKYYRSAKVLVQSGGHRHHAHTVAKHYQILPHITN